MQFAIHFIRAFAMKLTTQESIRAWILSALMVHGAVAGNPDAKRLYDDLLSNYNKLVRPVVNTTDVLKVCIKLKLSQLIDVVSKQNVHISYLLIKSQSSTIKLNQFKFLESEKSNYDHKSLGRAGKQHFSELTC